MNKAAERLVKAALYANTVPKKIMGMQLQLEGDRADDLSRPA
jgi:hypothetical protein